MRKLTGMMQFLLLSSLLLSGCASGMQDSAVSNNLAATQSEELKKAQQELPFDLPEYPSSFALPQSEGTYVMESVQQAGESQPYVQVVFGNERSGGQIVWMIAKSGAQMPFSPDDYPWNQTAYLETGPVLMAGNDEQNVYRVSWDDGAYSLALVSNLPLRRQIMETLLALFGGPDLQEQQVQFEDALPAESSQKAALEDDASRAALDS